MLGRTDFPVIGDHGYPLSMGPYGFYWLSIDGTDEDENHDDDVIEISGPLEAAFGTDGPLVDSVRRYISLQPWISGRMPRRGQTSVLDLIPVTPGETDANMWMAIVKVEHASGPDDFYVVPLAISFESDRIAVENGNLISRIRREGQDGVLYDGLSDGRFRARMLSAILVGETLLGEAGSLFCTTGFTQLDLEPSLDVESTLTTNERGETYINYHGGPVIKLFRRIEPGINPDLELRRFLTERSGYENLSDVYGALEYQSGESYTVAVLQESFASASSAMTAFGELCGAWLDAVDGEEPESEPEDGYWSSTAAVANHLPMPDQLTEALDLAGRLGETTAHLHLALGSLSEDPDIRPEAFSQHYQQSLYQSLRAGVRQELRAINRHAGSAGPVIEAAVRDIVLAERDILEWLDPIRRETVTGSRIRVHGDYRLDEVYMVDGEFVIEDFSGDHTRPISERRLRGSALRDVAQMLRSIDYLAMSTALEGSKARKAWAAWWSRAVGGAFVTSYLATMEDSPLIPDALTATDALLNAFAVARSLREMHWDLVNRPWLASVPLAGIRSTLGTRPSLID